MKPRPRFILTVLVTVIVSMFASPASAQHYFLERAPDGAILIYQDTSLGFALPGDTAGFPITITQPGSYRLASNIVVPDANTSAIEIAASHVSLDLNGFAILGPVVCSGTPFPCSPQGVGRGVHAASTAANTTVRNGTVHGMGGRGISLEGLGARVEGIHVSSNGGAGLFVLSSSVVVHNTALRNGGNGIIGTKSVVLGNVAFENGLRDIDLNVLSGWGQNVTGNGNVNPLGVPQTDGNVCDGALCP